MIQTKKSRGPIRPESLFLPLDRLALDLQFKPVFLGLHQFGFQLGQQLAGFGEFRRVAGIKLGVVEHFMKLADLLCAARPFARATSKVDVVP